MALGSRSGWRWARDRDAAVLAIGMALGVPLLLRILLPLMLRILLPLMLRIPLPQSLPLPLRVPVMLPLFMLKERKYKGIIEKEHRKQRKSRNEAMEGV
jgi:hypothetical protein